MKKEKKFKSLSTANSGALLRMKISGLTVEELGREDLRTFANMRGRKVLQRWRSAIPVLQTCKKEENL